jgi:hypothetical protein
MADQLIIGLIWSLGGLIVGYVSCWIVTESAIRAMAEQKTVDLQGYRLDAFRVIVGVFILLMVVLSSIRYYQVSNCQTIYNIAVAEALEQRSEAQGIETAAQVKLLTIDTQGDPARGRQARQEYVTAILNLEKIRRENPLPANPKCGSF